ncbi:pentatricopeptide repeat-containing protein At1g28690, mitochondrial-like [Bidens hawaiensis]|uniref:pentatricopeptide repeat-containing protein At1g28690, mitochondrial-like n=1 Tax=Bidens hawaiensis TaxID=980011 RepID=UPI00404A2728
MNKLSLLRIPTQNPSHGQLSPLTSTSLSLALQSYINSDTPCHGQKIHTHIIKTGFTPNTNILIKLLILHLKSSCLVYARQVFDEMPQPTLTAYNYMISGYIKHHEPAESFNLVRRLVLHDKPDGYTFSMILKASVSENNKLRIGKQVHAQIVKSYVVVDDVLSTALVDSYVKSGRIDYARVVFDFMMEKDVICLTSMISGYMKQGLVEDAEHVFEKTGLKDVVVFNAMIEGYSKSVETAKKAIDVYVTMQRVDFKPNMSTFASIIGACSLLSAFEVGQQVHGQLMKTEFAADVKMGSAVIDMYSKCGRIEDARRVFDEMPVKNVFSWTSMIDGYGKNGDPSEALDLFDQMQTVYRVKPNHVTFLGALSACGHAGLVSKGLEIFNIMEKDYSMKPLMEHYACMVDLLGRAGRLNQALEFVMSMPEKPNSDVWAALLSACRLHGDVEMASIAANELFKLSGDSRPGAYVALSNALADAGRWDRVVDIREVMNARDVLKETGSSWIGIDDGLTSLHVAHES